MAVHLSLSYPFRYFFPFPPPFHSPPHTQKRKKEKARYPDSLFFHPFKKKRHPSSIMPCYASCPFYFLLKEHPSVRRALPPVGWHSTVEQPPQMTTVWACEKTVVMVKQPGHLTSMKKERGAGTSIYCVMGGPLARNWARSEEGCGEEMGRRTLSLCLRASAAGVGLRRSTARTWWFVEGWLASCVWQRAEEKVFGVELGEGCVPSLRLCMKLVGMYICISETME